MGGDLNSIRREMETNYFGTLSMARAFAPVLAANGGGSGYGTSKAAVWAMTNALRVEFSQQNTQATALYMASTGTDIFASLDVPKNTAQAVAIAVLDGLEAGELEVLADDETPCSQSNVFCRPGHRLPTGGAAHSASSCPEVVQQLGGGSGTVELCLRS